MNSLELKQACLQVKEASKFLGILDTKAKNKALQAIHDALLLHKDAILKANKQDMERADAVYNLSTSMKERLLLSDKKISDMALGVKQVMDLPDPVFQIIGEHTLSNGLEIIKETTPFGVIAMIYESRPNVTVDAAVLCIKSGNACILRGGKEAHYTNEILTIIMQKALESVQIPAQVVYSVLDSSRELIQDILHMRGIIDLVIPRGSKQLIQTVISDSIIPVIETGSGVCHTYIDKEADIEKAEAIIINAKVQKPSVCNAMETLLVHRHIAPLVIEKIFPLLKQHGVELRGDAQIASLYSSIKPATEEDCSTEYNDLILSIKIVDSVEEAVKHIIVYSTHHSECIVSENKDNVAFFMNHIDAACLYHNASTRFTDGFEFGFGAEIGISTQKLHVRGPMGLDSLVTYKYKVFGNGQVRK